MLKTTVDIIPVSQRKVCKCGRKIHPIYDRDECLTCFNERRNSQPKQERKKVIDKYPDYQSPNIIPIIETIYEDDRVITIDHKAGQQSWEWRK